MKNTELIELRNMLAEALIKVDSVLGGKTPKLSPKEQAELKMKRLLATGKRIKKQDIIN